MSVSLLDPQIGLPMLYRWGHLLFGVTWIGLLYYFNLVQGEYFKEADGGAKSDAIQKLVPKALWWFRWGAVFTLITGLLLLHSMSIRLNSYTVLAVLLGTVMFLNVWLIIWPNQKIVIENATRVAKGESALEQAPKALGKAGLASRHNTLFSVPMLFFMAASGHLGGPGAMPLMGEAGGGSTAALGLAVLIIAALEGNAIAGKTGPITTIKGVIHCGLALALVLYAVVEFL